MESIYFIIWDCYGKLYNYIPNSKSQPSVCTLIGTVVNEFILARAPLYFEELHSSLIKLNVEPTILSFDICQRC